MKYLSYAPLVLVAALSSTAYSVGKLTGMCEEYANASLSRQAQLKDSLEQYCIKKVEKYENDATKIQKYLDLMAAGFEGTPDGNASLVDRKLIKKAWLPVDEGFPSDLLAQHEDETFQEALRLSRLSQLEEQDRKMAQQLEVQFQKDITQQLEQDALLAQQLSRSLTLDEHESKKNEEKKAPKPEKTTFTDNEYRIANLALKNVDYSLFRKNEEYDKKGLATFLTDYNWSLLKDLDEGRFNSSSNKIPEGFQLSMAQATAIMNKVLGDEE